MNHIIYCHRNKINGKLYIGQTKSTLIRRTRKDGSGYEGSSYFWNAIQKYGWDNFESTILEENISDELIDEREKYWIHFFETTKPEYGYNHKIGGKNTHQSENGYKREIYCKETGEYFKSLSDAAEWAGLQRTSMHQLTQVANGERYYAGKHPQTGEPLHWCFSKKEIVNPIKEKPPARSRRVRNIETGLEFNTLKEAAEWAGLKDKGAHIIACLQGKQKTSGKHPITKERLHWEEA